MLLYFNGWINIMLVQLLASFYYFFSGINFISPHSCNDAKIYTVFQKVGSILKPATWTYDV